MRKERERREKNLAIEKGIILTLEKQSVKDTFIKEKIDEPSGGGSLLVTFLL